MEERRRFARVPVSLSIRFQGLNDFSEFIHGHLRDVSQGGLFVQTSKLKPVGSEVTLQIPDGAGRFHTITGIVRSVILPDDESRKFPPGMGIEFVRVDAALKALIDRIIAHHRRDR